MLRKNTVKVSVFTLIFAFSVLLFNYNSASAQSCNGTGCNGQSPSATGCLNDAVWVNAAPFTFNSVQGYVQLMWSDACRAAFTRVSTASNIIPPSIKIQTYFSRKPCPTCSTLFTSHAFATSMYNQTYDYTQVVDTSHIYHVDGNLYYDTRTLAWTPGGRIYTTNTAFQSINGVSTQLCLLGGDC